jgi:hypothetical protein
MAKQLKKIEYSAEDEAKFRQRLADTAIRSVKPKYVPDYGSIVPSGFENKIVNNPNLFTTKSKSSDVHKLKLEFLKYTFGKYRVPAFLDFAWYKRPAIAETSYNNTYGRLRNDAVNQPTPRPEQKLYDFKAWWICLASGGSLYKEYCKDFLTKKEVHVFSTCPHDITPEEAVIYAVALSYGASIGSALRLAKTKLNQKRLDVDVSGKFWREVIQFFSMHTPDTIEHTNDFLDYLWAEFNRSLNFSPLGKNYTIKTLHKKMKDWHYELARVKVMGDHKWDGIDLPDYEIEVEDDSKKKHRWTFTQIKAAKTLAAEGTAMRHCVYSYRDQCKSGLKSIWSVKSYNESGVEKRHLTIEMVNFTRTIVQVRGRANRSATFHEHKIVNKWAFAYGLGWN